MDHRSNSPSPPAIYLLQLLDCVVQSWGGGGGGGGGGGREGRERGERGEREGRERGDREIDREIL